GVDHAGLLSGSHRAFDQLVGAVGIGHDNGGDAPADVQLTADLLVHDAGNDGGDGAELAQGPGSSTALGNGDDGAGIDVGGSGAGSMGGSSTYIQTGVAEGLPLTDHVAAVALYTVGNGSHGPDAL